MYTILETGKRSVSWIDTCRDYINRCYITHKVPGSHKNIPSYLNLFGVQEDPCTKHAPFVCQFWEMTSWVLNNINCTVEEKDSEFGISASCYTSNQYYILQSNAQLYYMHATRFDTIVSTSSMYKCIVCM